MVRIFLILNKAAKHTASLKNCAMGERNGHIPLIQLSLTPFRELPFVVEDISIS